MRALSETFIALYFNVYLFVLNSWSSCCLHHFTATFACSLLLLLYFAIKISSKPFGETGLSGSCRFLTRFTSGSVSLSLSPFRGCVRFACIWHYLLYLFGSWFCVTPARGLHLRITFLWLLARPVVEAAQIENTVPLCLWVSFGGGAVVRWLMQSPVTPKIPISESTKRQETGALGFLWEGEGSEDKCWCCNCTVLWLRSVKTPRPHDFKACKCQGHNFYS